MANRPNKGVPYLHAELLAPLAEQLTGNVEHDAKLVRRFCELFKLPAPTVMAALKTHCSPASRTKH
jgi:hypothetical protein